MNKPGTYLRLLSSYLFYSFLFSGQLVSQPRVLAVMPNHLGSSSHLVLDYLAESGYSITSAGVSRQVNACAWSGSLGNQVFTNDTLLSEIISSDPWDVIVIMPSDWQNIPNPFGDLIACTPFMNLLKDAKQKEKITWATCGGVRVLAAADIIDGVKVSGQGAYAQEYTAAGATFMGASIPPVCDQNIITSTRGMYYMQENFDIISTALEKSGKNFNRFDSAPAVHDIQPAGLEPSIWNHQFASDAPQGLRSVCHTQDGGVIATGYTWANPQHNSDLLLVKTDVMGNPVWAKSFGDTGWEFGWSVITASGGGYVAAGYTSSTRALDKNIYIIKVDIDGNLLWERILGGGGVDIARDIVEASDGSLMIAGYSEQSSNGEHNVLLVKLDAEGEYQWTKTFGDADPEIARSIIQNKEGNFVIGGETGTGPGGSRDMLLLSVDPEGSLLWQKNYHKSRNDCGYEVIEIPAGGYYLIGLGDVLNQDFLEMAVVKTDAEGNCLSHTMYEATTRFYDYGKSIALSSNGTLAFCGAAKKKNTRQNKLFLILIDSDGRTLIDNWFDLDGSSWCTSMMADTDNNFVVAGQSTPDNLQYHSWLFKIQNPMVAGTAAQTQSTGGFLCYPSPFSDRLTIQTHLKGTGTGTIAIFDSMGKMITTWNMDRDPSPVQFWDAQKNNGEPVEPGAYIIRYTSGDYIGHQKVLFLH